MAVKQNGMTEAQLYDWVTKIIRREQSAGLHGNLVIFFEGGTVTRVKIEKSELPAFTNIRE